MDLLRNSIIVFSILPFVPFLLVYFVHYRWMNNKNTALLLAMDVTTAFLILSVSALFNNIFNTGFGFYLILLLLLIAVGLVGGAQNRIKGGVDLKRMGRAVWRMTFVLMSTSYILFAIIGLIRYIFKSM
ncbi:hypothetical protein UB51_03635 [Paenibacillus sp. IHBB 10380]|nr:hypothetical protein UB51_03635 [Paenibacillus sp. IHBB 10380]